MRGLVTNPQQYSSKLVNDSPEAIEFKTAKMVASMQNMLTSICVPGASASTSSTAHVQALATQLVTPSAVPSTSSALEPPAMHPSTSTGLQQPAPSSAFSNQLMDMILQLQGQIQAMQQQASAQPTTSPQTEHDPTQKSKHGKRKRKSMPVEEESASVNQPSTSFQCVEQQEPQAEEPKQPLPKKSKKGKKQTK